MPDGQSSQLLSQLEACLSEVLRVVAAGDVASPVQPITSSQTGVICCEANGAIRSAAFS